jgi:hypothetical protein
MDFLAGQPRITKDQAMAEIAQSNFLKVQANVQDTAECSGAGCGRSGADDDRNGGKRNRRRWARLAIHGETR